MLKYVVIAFTVVLYSYIEWQLVTWHTARTIIYSEWCTPATPAGEFLSVAAPAPL